MFISTVKSAKGENTPCTINRQRNKGAIYWKMTIDKRQIRAESAPCSARCTLKRQGNKGAISWKMTREGRKCHVHLHVK